MNDQQLGCVVGLVCSQRGFSAWVGFARIGDYGIGHFTLGMPIGSRESISVDC